MVLARERLMIAAVCGLLAVGLAIASLPVLLANASGHLQDTSAVDISGRECTFWLDFDGDGEGDEPVAAHPDRHTLQETAVVGGCEFKVNVETEATLVIVSELVQWSSSVTVTREPEMERPYTLHSADNQIPGLVGGMTVEIQHSGVTPRSGKVRTLRDEYEHEVQVPLPFRLLEVTIITPDGRQDRHEVSVQSASAAFLYANQRVFASSVDTDAGTQPIVGLASDLMGDGYPQIADQVLALEDVAYAKRGPSAWMWATVALSSAIVLTAAVAGIAAYARGRARSVTAGENQFDLTSGVP